MKTVLITNVITKVVFIVCVTVLSFLFNSTSLLWWFMLTPFLGYTYKEHTTEKGVDDNA